MKTDINIVLLCDCAHCHYQFSIISVTVLIIILTVVAVIFMINTITTIIIPCDISMMITMITIFIIIIIILLHYNYLLESKLQLFVNRQQGPVRPPQLLPLPSRVRPDGWPGSRCDAKPPIPFDLQAMKLQCSSRFFGIAQRASCRVQLSDREPFLRVAAGV